MGKLVQKVDAANFEELQAAVYQDTLAGVKVWTSLDLCLAAVARWETRPGVTVTDDPDDPGRLTVYGLSQAAHPEIHAGTTWEEAAKIYRDDYWVETGAALLWNSMPAALCAFDCMVLHARGAAIIQEALNVRRTVEGATLLAVDNVFGPMTALALQNAKEADHVAIAAARFQYVAGLPHAEKYVNGWRNRFNDIARACILRLRAESNP